MIPGNANPLLLASAAADAAAAGPIKSVRFNSADSAHLSRTPSSAGNLKKWTWAGWVKRSGTAGQQLFSAGTGTEERAFIRFLGSGDTLCFEQKQNSTWNTTLRSSAVFRDFSAWYHIVVAYDSAQSTAANRVKMYVNGAEITEFGSTTYPPQNQDGKINTTTIHAVGTTSYSTGTTPFSGYMADVYFIDGQALDPTSFGAYDDNGVWQAAAYSGTFGTNGFHLLDFANESTVGHDSSGNENDFTANNISDGESPRWFFDGSAGTKITGTIGTALGSGDFTVEMFIEKTTTNHQEALFSFGGSVCTFETDTASKVRYQTGSTYGSTIAANDRTHIAWVRDNSKGYIYVDGTLVSPSSGISDTTNYTATAFAIGSRPDNGEPFEGYLDNLRVVVGTAVYTSNFTVPSTPLTAVTNTKLLTLTSTTLEDISGQSVSLTNNGVVDEASPGKDILFDVPTNGTQSDTGAGGEVSGNYCVLSPLNKSTGTLSNGNLDYSISAVGSCRGTMMVSSGKWYFEVKLTASGNPYVGIAGIGQAVSGGAGYVAPNAIAANNEGSIYYRYGGSTTYPGKTVSIGAGTIGIAIDVDNKKMWWSKNGTWYKFNSSANQTTTISEVEAGNFSTSFSNLEGDFFTVHLGNSTTNNTTYEFNGGQRAFAYSAPSGYKAWNTANMSAATIPDGSDYFDTVLWSGNGTQARAITGLNYSPDLVWLKRRNAGSTSHQLHDAVRGASAGTVYADLTNAEDSNYNLTSFDSGGFTLGTVSDLTSVNKSGGTYVAWAWNAGANSNKTYTVKVVSDSGNKYRFDDFGTSAVTLDLAEGSTYVFDQSDSSNSGHPLRFSTTSDGTHNSGTEYTTGVTTTGTPGSAGAKTTIVVGSGVATLYYYCSSHSGMGGQANTNSTAGASNFDGTIQATVKANPEAGMSIVSYTGNQTEGATVGHGLNSQPLFVTVKDRSTTKEWYTLVKKGSGTGASSFGVGYLNGNNTLNGLDTNLFRTNSFDNTPPTSSVFQLGSDGGGWSNTLNDDNNYVAYCISPVAGYSAVGSYEGNGSTDGPFVYTGFRPAFVMIKNADANSDWSILDTARDPYNRAENYLLANSNNAESSPGYFRDYLSNGFKIRDNGTGVNTSGQTYIYVAFAENPFQANGGLAR